MPARCRGVRSCINWSVQWAAAAEALLEAHTCCASARTHLHTHHPAHLFCLHGAGACGPGRVALYRLERAVGGSSSRGSAGGQKSAGLPQGAWGWRMVLVAQRDMAGPVTVLQDFKGMLLVSVGKTVETYSLRALTPHPHASPPASSLARESGISAAAAAAVAAASASAARGNNLTLVKAAFYDMPLLVTSMAVVKDFLLVGDVHHGVSFLRYNDTTKVLEGLSRDFERHDVSSTGFIINAQKLLFAATDASGTLWQYEYVKNHPLSWNGQRLLPGGALHIGHPATKLLSVKVASPDGLNRHALLVGTHSGGFGIWSPVWDKDSAGRLQRLQPLLDRALSHTGGLNPRAFRRRHLKLPRAVGHCNPCTRVCHIPPCALFACG
ncbi:CPSF A subunit region-domain-containing protein [Dunaliella salina]|uniref:CPSF A subunit region-domain-containing protein n=1 Tax=Dunaliella salina TaxID=3046 RepID=A0ABQ7HAE8_DUNSA|nr:CPSF A subunit region-domain-containing protein [Dunaliella salina]|eukprot:KAF5843830.1 CPSF A subunit region-domain-containing protein [Dunaliella salina]